MEGFLYAITLVVAAGAIFLVYCTIEELRNAIKQSKQP
jgi:hypothetical protein